jgi:hypothetical protein
MLRPHSPRDPRGSNVVALRRCPGSELSSSTTRVIAAHEALRGQRPESTENDE